MKKIKLSKQEIYTIAEALELLDNDLTEEYIQLIEDYPEDAPKIARERFQSGEYIDSIIKKLKEALK